MKFNKIGKNPFSPRDKVVDFRNKFQFGKLFKSPFDCGYWSILQPYGLQNHAPQLCWLNHNKLACVWMSGGQEGNCSMSILISILNRRYLRWSSPKLISQDQTRSEQNPFLFILDNGVTTLIHTAQDSRDINEIKDENDDSPFSMQWTARLRSQSKKNHRSKWTRSKDLLDKSAFCRHPPYRRNDGNWILPIYRSLEQGGMFGHDFSEVIILDKDAQFLDGPISIPSSKGRVHGSIVRSFDGSNLLQFFRSRLADSIYRSIGSINGEEWSEPKPIDLPNNNSSIQALRLKSGRLLMVFNRFSVQQEDNQVWGDASWPSRRWPMSVALSEDDGITWPWIRDIDNGEGFCGEANWHFNNQLAYPSVVEGIGGELHLAYSWKGRAAIKYLCINEEEILGSWWKE